MLAHSHLQYARKKDAADPLAHFQQAFVEAEPGLLYLDGNSLGKLPKATLELSHTLIEQQWGKRLIRGWNEGWLSLPQRIGDKIGRLIGAQPGEVLIADSTSVNLFKLVMAALTQNTGKSHILTDDLNFPSDLYILQGINQAMGNRFTVEVVSSQDGIHGPEEAIINHIHEGTALVTLSHTVFKSAFIYDMEKITAAAHEVGALILWDLSHSVGSVAVDLSTCGADLAVGCTYKYLNGGPGAPAFLYVNKQLQDKLNNPIAGWMGQKNLFDFSLDYEPAAGILRFLTGTPSVISTALIEPGVDLLLEAGMKTLVAKSQAQTEYFCTLWETYLKPLGFELQSPTTPQKRGSHITLSHPHALAIDLALIQAKQVIPDFRAPDNLRFGIAPLYTRFEDIYLTVERLVEIVEHKMYEAYLDTRPEVT